MWQGVFKCLPRNGRKIILSIVTGDETMALYYDLLFKKKQWKRVTQKKTPPPLRKARVNPLTIKLMATVFIFFGGGGAVKKF